MFVSVSKARLPKGLNYLWAPHLLVRPSCRSGKVLLDCFFSSALGKDVVMLLLSRRVKDLRVEPTAPVDCPILYSEGCSPLHYQRALNSVSESISTGKIEGLLLKPQDARARSLIVDLFKIVLSQLCFPDPPVEFSQVYVLLGLDPQRRRAYVALGDRLIESPVLEEVLYGHLGGLEAVRRYI